MARPKKNVEEKKVVRRGRPKKVEEEKVINLENLVSELQEFNKRLDKLEKKVADIDADVNDLFKDVEDTTKSNSSKANIDEFFDLFAKSKNVKRPQPTCYVYVSTRRYF